MTQTQSPPNNSLNASANRVAFIREGCVVIMAHRAALIRALDVFVDSKRDGIMNSQKSISMHLWLTVLLVYSLIMPVEFCFAQTTLSETYAVKLDEYGDLSTD